MIETLQLRRIEVIEPDPARAVEALAEGIALPDLAGVVFFCSATYDRDSIATAMRDRFSCPVVGCTTAGEIGTSYRTDSIVGIGFSQSEFRVHPVVIPSVQGLGLTEAAFLADEVSEHLEIARKLGPEHLFGLLLIDGLSLSEERVVSHLYHAFQGMPIVGGSAGDNLQFEETYVYYDGHFHRNAAVLVVVETALPYRAFRWQHFEPTEVDFIVTASDPASRTVYEFDGEPAVEAYARAVGVQPEELDAHVFSLHPIMIQVGEEWYVRSISRANADGSLTFLCAIDNGLPLTLARGGDYLAMLDRQVAALRADIGNPLLTIGCDCILRRLEILEKQIEEDVASRLQQVNFLGFSTYGEQINGLHVNQTLTGISIGEG